MFLPVPASLDRLIWGAFPFFLSSPRSLPACSAASPAIAHSFFSSSFHLDLDLVLPCLARPPLALHLQRTPPAAATSRAWGPRPQRAEPLHPDAWPSGCRPAATCGPWGAGSGLRGRADAEAKRAATPAPGRGCANSGTCCTSSATASTMARRPPAAGGTEIGKPPAPPSVPLDPVGGVMRRKFEKIARLIRCSHECLSLA